MQTRERIEALEGAVLALAVAEFRDVSDEPRDKDGQWTDSGGDNTYTDQFGHTYPEYPAGRTEGWPHNGLIPVTDVVQTGERTNWQMGAWQGRIAEDDVVLYRSMGGEGELRSAFTEGRWQTRGDENVGSEVGTTQFGTDPDELASWKTFGPRSVVVEVNVAGLPFQAIRAPEPLNDETAWPAEEAVRGTRGEGLGIIGPIEERRIERVGLVEDGKITEWVPGTEFLDPNAEVWGRIAPYTHEAA